jgi:hypothetical protein
VEDQVTPREARGSRRRVISAFVLAGLALVAVPLVLSRLVSQPDGQVLRYEIPRGTAAALARGEAVDVLPADLQLGLRDKLIVVNLDDQPHAVGPFRLAPGEELARDADQITSFSGFCSLHLGGRIDIQVRSVKT